MFIVFLLYSFWLYDNILFFDFGVFKNNDTAEFWVYDLAVKNQQPSYFTDLVDRLKFDIHANLFFFSLRKEKKTLTRLRRNIT